MRGIQKLIRSKNKYVFSKALNSGKTQKRDALTGYVGRGVKATHRFRVPSLVDLRRHSTRSISPIVGLHLASLDFFVSVFYQKTERSFMK